MNQSAVLFRTAFRCVFPRLLAPQAFGIGVSCSIIGRASQNGPLGGLRPHLDRVHVTWPSLLVAPTPRPPLARVPQGGFDLGRACSIACFPWRPTHPARCAILLTSTAACRRAARLRA